MTSNFMAVIVFFLASIFSLQKSSGIKIPGPVVLTDCGAVEGMMSTSRFRRNYFGWLSIPYAKAPVADLRFEPPQPYGKWNGVLQGMQYPPRCAQYDAIQDLLMGQEDCLYLNVFIPKELFESRDLHDRLPVMIFLHGGAYISGSSRDFRPEYFMDEDVVLVTVNYRLASFGFLNTNDGLIRGNMGLKDQTLALTWIKNNIRYFGGDSNRITIFGESAGASSAHYHMLSPMSRGLFQRAISQSGVAASTFAFNLDPTFQAETFAQELSCPTQPSRSMVNCIRSKSTLEILLVHAKAAVWYKAESRRKELLFVPTIELDMDDGNTFLANHPDELLEKGDFVKIPWMSGVNSAEGLIWMYPFRSALESHWPRVAVSELFLNDRERLRADDIRDFYMGNLTDFGSEEAFQKYLQLISDRMFYIQFQRAIKWHAREAPLYAYVYDKVGPSFAEVFFSLKDSLPRLLGIVIARAKDLIRSEIFSLPRPRDGACHGDEFLMQSPYLPLYFIGTKHPDVQFSRDFVKLWVSFASQNQSMPPLEFRNMTFPRFELKEDPDFFRLHEQPRLVKLNLDKRVEFWESLDSNKIPIIEF